MERPILFSGPMVRAILEGRKTQTRRVFKVRGVDGMQYAITSPAEEVLRFDDGTFHYLSTAALSGPYPCPYGQPGDRLWVRETIRKTGEFPGGYATSEYVADGTPTVADAWPWQRRTLAAIHCPRGLSRILLEITDVRVQCVQDISEDDAIAEGVIWTVSPREAFANLWDEINIPRGFGWNTNPWVWALTFKRMTEAEA